MHAHHCFFYFICQIVQISSSSRSYNLNLNQIKVEYVISFSDALFAFSITFMALSIQIPTFSSNIAESELTRRLGQLLIPNIIHYIVSFMVVGMYWISYHRIFEHIRRADITLVWVNLLFLLFVALVGYFTGLLTTYDTHRIVVISFSAQFTAHINLHKSGCIINRDLYERPTKRFLTT